MSTRGAGLTQRERDLLERADRLRVYSRGTNRALNKPLLVLWGIGRVHRRQPRLEQYSVYEPQMQELLVRFGGSPKSIHPELAFFHLRNDGIWELEGADALTAPHRGRGVHASELRGLGVKGGFPVEDQKLLIHSQALRRAIAQLMLEKYFARVDHRRVLGTVGLPQSWAK